MVSYFSKSKLLKSFIEGAKAIIKQDLRKILVCYLILLKFKI